ncbi:hypothetical protein [Streptomyces sp. NPDC086777]|uniref:hypothetical protein n=1 Tax=Streptomyces sp. NPDC086777 TaxID=3154866 RepID=UPI003450457F
MSGLARDAKYYGDRLVYELLETNGWIRYHAAHCGCVQDRLTGHAGSIVLPRGKTGS